MDTYELTIKTSERSQFMAITSKITDYVSQQGWKDGVLTIFVPHTTAGITINENADPDVQRDMKSFIDELVPQSRHFRHSEGNSDAHIKASLMGSSVQLILKNGRPLLGGWQGIYFCEFDGPRTRKLYLAFI